MPVRSPAEFTVNMAELADDMFTAAGTIGVIAEAATSSYTVKVDGATLTYNTTSALTGQIKIALSLEPTLTVAFQVSFPVFWAN